MTEVAARRRERRDPHRWGDVVVPLDGKADLGLPLGTSYSGRPIEVPVQVWRGPEPGPVVFVSGALHGDEINGTGAVRELILRPEFQLARGTLVLVPVMNLPGFERHSRYLPDRRDLNRSFPGSPEGSLAARLAHLLFTEVVARCDYGIDLHSAALRRTNFPNLRADLEDPEVARLATAFGAELLLDSRGPEGSLRREACEVGCPVVILEAGEVWKVEPGVVEYALRGVRNALIGLGLVEGEPERPAFRAIVDRSKWVRANASGFLHFHVSPGEFVREDQAIATETSLLGQDLGVLTAPHSGVVLGMTTLPSAASGDPVCNLGYVGPEARRRLERVLAKLPEEDLFGRLREALATSVLVADGEAPQPAPGAADDKA